jgi:molecular chaperone Hsp33
MIIKENMAKINKFSDDLVQPFQLESSALRGRLIRLGPTLDLILHQHAYPAPVGVLLGEAMVIAAALGTALKYEGVFTLQAKGDGLVRMLVADVTHDGGIRAYAQFDKEKLAQANDKTRLFGKGHLAFTVDQQLKDDRYQGIVELKDESLAEAVQHYFRQSEQIATGLIVAVNQDSQGRWRGGCLMLQQMPRAGSEVYESDTSVADDWLRAMMLMGTCTSVELTDRTLDPCDLLYRLFHEEGVRVFDPHMFRHQCRCSLKRVRDMLRSLPRDEIDSLAVKGVVDITCEFCNKNYRFDEKQRDDIYAQSVEHSPE